MFTTTFDCLSSSIGQRLSGMHVKPLAMSHNVTKTRNCTSANNMMSIQTRQSAGSLFNVCASTTYCTVPNIQHANLRTHCHSDMTRWLRHRNQTCHDSTHLSVSGRHTRLRMNCIAYHSKRTASSTSDSEWGRHDDPSKA